MAVDAILTRFSSVLAAMNPMMLVPRLETGFSAYRDTSITLNTLSKTLIMEEYGFKILTQTFARASMEWIEGGKLGTAKLAARKELKPVDTTKMGNNHARVIMLVGREDGRGVWGLMLEHLVEILKL